MRSGCRSHGKYKIKHVTKEDAEAHRQQHQRVSGLHQVDVYKCGNCGFYHVGRRKKTAEYLRERRIGRQQDKRLENLVGMLIGILRGTYPSAPRKRKEKPVTADTKPVEEDYEPPEHDCPIQGPGTKLVRALNIKTGEQRLVCIWCQMAAHMTGGIENGR